MTDLKTILDPGLPAPAHDDITYTVTGAGFPITLPTAHWTCRYCDFTERGPLTTDAERRRCFAHMYACPKRPADDVPDNAERADYQTVHAAGLRRDLLVLRLQISDRRRLLRRTWFFEFATRRALRAQIAELSKTISGVHERAARLGLDVGWTEPNFRPCRTP